MLQCMLLWRSIVGLFQLWVQLVLQLFGFLLRAHLAHGCVSMTCMELLPDHSDLEKAVRMTFSCQVSQMITVFPCKYEYFFKSKPYLRWHTHPYTFLTFPKRYLTLDRQPHLILTRCTPILWANRAVKRWDGYRYLEVEGPSSAVPRFSPRVSPSRWFFGCKIGLETVEEPSGYLGYVFRFTYFDISSCDGKKCSKCTCVPRAILQAGSSTAS
jgi:hypothetical protein